LGLGRAIRETYRTARTAITIPATTPHERADKPPMTRSETRGESRTFISREKSEGFAA